MNRSKPSSKIWRLVGALAILAVVMQAPWSVAFDQDGSTDKPEGSLVSTAREVTPEDIQRLKTAFKDGSEADVITAVANILGKDPKNLLALNTLGLQYFRTNKLGLARMTFLRGLKMHPNSPTLHHNLGLVAAAQGETSEAHAGFLKALQINDGHIPASATMGSIQLEHRAMAQAVKNLKIAYEAVKSDIRRGRVEAVEIANNYALALVGAEKLEEARQIFQEIDESETRSELVLLNYVIFLVELTDKHTEAARILNKLKFMSDDKTVLRRIEELERKIKL